jgi:hypothetical protein
MLAGDFLLFWQLLLDHQQIKWYLKYFYLFRSFVKLFCRCLTMLSMYIIKGVGDGGHPGLTPWFFDIISPMCPFPLCK